jgi:hypothetical protein
MRKASGHVQFVSRTWLRCLDLPAAWSAPLTLPGAIRETRRIMNRFLYVARVAVALDVTVTLNNDNPYNKLTLDRRLTYAIPPLATSNTSTRAFALRSYDHHRPLAGRSRSTRGAHLFEFLWLYVS